MSDVHVGKVGDEIIPHEEPHQNPVVYDVLKVIAKWKLVLEGEEKYYFIKFLLKIKCDLML